MQRLESRQASLALARDWAADDGTRIPVEVVEAELAGDHPVAAWRKQRGLTARDLAARAGISAACLSEIVNRKTSGSLDADRAIADTLEDPIDVLLPIWA